MTDFSVPLDYLRLLIGPAAFASAIERLGMEALAARENATLSSITFCHICLEHVRATRNEALGLPQPVPFGNFALLIAAAAQGKDLADVLRRCAHAMEILRPDLVVKTRLQRDHLRFSIESAHPSSPAVEIGLEFFLISLHCALRWMTGAPLRPEHIRVARRFPGYERSLLSVFMSPLVTRGRGVTICYALADAKRPVLPMKYDSWAAHELPEYARLLQEAADRLNDDRPRPSHSLADRVGEMILTGTQGQMCIAARLGMSEATLRRRLAETGLGYKDIVSRVEKDEAARLLLTGMPLPDIAAKMRFSDVRSFRRACQRWFGTSPALLRQQAMANKAGQSGSGIGSTTQAI